jgi:hypothetical protein
MTYVPGIIFSISLLAAILICYRLRSARLLMASTLVFVIAIAVLAITYQNAPISPFSRQETIALGPEQSNLSLIVTGVAGAILGVIG